MHVSVLIAKSGAQPLIYGSGLYPEFHSWFFMCLISLVEYRKMDALVRHKLGNSSELL